MPDPDSDDIPLLPPLSPQIPESRNRDEIDRAVEKMRRDGLSAEEVAAEFGLDPDTLHRWARPAQTEEEVDAPDPSTEPQHPLPDRPQQPSYQPRGVLKVTPKLVPRVEPEYVEPWTPPKDGMPAGRTLYRETPEASIAPLLQRFLDNKFRIGIATAVVLAAVLAALSLVDNRPKDPAATPTLPHPPIPSLLPSKENQERAIEVARSFLATTSWEEKLPYVRRPERARERMREWYRRPHHRSPRYPDGAPFHTELGTFINGAPFVALEADSGDPEHPIVVAVDVSGEQPKVDWESHVHYQPMGWGDFKRSRPTEPLAFRVQAEPSNELIAPFDDPEKWLSLRLTSPFEIVGLNAYAERESPLGLLLKNLFQYGGKRQLNLILHLRFPDNDQLNPAVEITGANQGWIEP